MNAQKDFIESVKAAAVASGSLEDLPDPRHMLASKPVASWFNGTFQEICDVDKLLDQARRDNAAGQRAVCVIENIDCPWMSTIGTAWEIEPLFFAKHGVSPKGDDAWLTLFPKHRNLAIKKGPSKHKYIDGVFEHHYLTYDSDALAALAHGARVSTFRRKHWFPKHPYAPSFCTRMSYYLFLVDPPPVDIARSAQMLGKKVTPSMQSARSKTTLRMQCATSRSGIMLPQVLKHCAYGLRQTLHCVFKHSWHLNVLFDQGLVRELAINRGELLHLMAASLHQTNLKAIDREIKAISFQELRRPDMATNAKLLNLREVLSELSTGTTETSKYVPRHVKMFYETLYDRQSGLKDHIGVLSPVEKLATIKQEASDLERFLMDSFQLLMSSISVIETQYGAQQTRINMEQATRTARLTQLAFIYVPLTFVTSIFGMNVTEFGTQTPIWVCFATLAVVAVATAAIFGGYELVNVLKKRASPAPIARQDSMTPYIGSKQSR